MCRFFVDSHLAYDADEIAWPEPTEDERSFLVNLPIWDEAVNTEHETALLVRAMADAERDPVLAEAIGLQAFEEERHSVLVSALTGHYGIAVSRRPAPSIGDPEWAFLRSGWSESIDSFFAFGVYAVARTDALIPTELLDVFDVVMQEEARHILFFESWRLYRRRRRARRWPVLPVLATAGANLPAAGADLAAVTVNVVDRLRLAFDAARKRSRRDENFLLSGARVLDGLTPRSFLATCLAEHARRLAPYDPALPRPGRIPALARGVLRVLPDHRPSAPTRLGQAPQ